MKMLSYDQISDMLDRLQSDIEHDPSDLDELDQDCLYLVMTEQAIYTADGEVVLTVHR